MFISDTAMRGKAGGFRRGREGLERQEGGREGRKREGGREKEGESERAVGAAWHRPGRSRRRGGSRRWPGKQEVEARRCARVGTRRSPVGEEDDRGGE